LLLNLHNWRKSCMSMLLRTIFLCVPPQATLESSLTLTVCPISVSALAPHQCLHIDPTCVFLPPKSTNRLAENALSSIASALATCFDVNIAVAKRHLRTAEISEWGGVRRVDSTAGDTMRASSLGRARADSRDATYVRVRCS
jgi:hypothetical protein